MNNKYILPKSVAKRKLVNGNKIQFWNDIWLGDQKLSTRFPRLFPLELMQNCLIVDQKMTSCWRWCWRRDIRGGEESSQLDNLNIAL